MGKLAINGGIPVRKESYMKWPQVNKEQREVLLRTYDSGVWGTGGKQVGELVEKMNGLLKVPYGLAVSNGTVAIEIALRTLGIGSGDEVIVPDYTFISTASSVVMVGATPVFCDVELNTFNINPDEIKQCITKKTKAIIVVHIGGMACDMKKICQIAKENNLFVIEDCAHAIGAFYDNKALGTLGDIGTFSFQSSKLVTSGEGGYICTSSAEWYKKMSALVNCGRDLDNMSWYKHLYIGTNARMSEFQACLLNVQLERFEELISKIQENVEPLRIFLEQNRCLCPRKQSSHKTNYYIYGCLYNGMEQYGVKRKLFIRALRAEGIPISEGYKCLHNQKCFIANGGENACSYPNSTLLELSKSLWFNFNLFIGDKKDVEDVIVAIEKIEDNIEELKGFATFTQYKVNL